MTNLVSVEQIEKNILLIRGHRVMLDSVLAELYGETIKRLNQQVRRNLKRFPSDFMFQLTEEEYQSLRLHFATLETGRGGRRYTPFAFTEHHDHQFKKVFDAIKELITPPVSSSRKIGFK